MRPLAPPEDVETNETAHEMVRFWIADEEHQLTLNIGLFDPDEEPRLWGSILADVAQHSVNGMLQDRPDAGSSDLLLAQIEAGFADRLNQYPEFSGSLQGSKH
ncbi:DUF5076 domain-containing protein [Ruegeria lacuscaerulensis]|uniref:DUF5076 domain-containing protein n=1 Tax=Ruegeria lacuscaerulensis TaxID=55218 RepID=UPI00147B3D4E|nr:DUF5076 domain-containing protein [Ruegeria lacuscaerulensis]